MSKHGRHTWGIAIALFGFGTILSELVRYWVWDRPMQGAPIAIGTAVVFTGAWLLNPAGAERWSGVLVERFVTVVSAMPFGRRATDKAANAGVTTVIVPTGERQVVKPVPEKPTAMEGQ